VSNQIAHWVVFGLDRGRYALPLRAVDRVVRAAYVTPLPHAPSVVLGALDIEGRVLPVFSLRRRFGLPEREIRLEDQFLIARSVFGLPPTAAVDAASVTAEPGHIRGIIALPDGLVLIHDLDSFLSPDEVRTMDDALSRTQPHAG
jgi:purine-binding chemotaxis protein CheW